MEYKQQTAIPEEPLRYASLSRPIQEASTNYFAALYVVVLCCDVCPPWQVSLEREMFFNLQGLIRQSKGQTKRNGVEEKPHITILYYHILFLRNAH